MEMTIYSREYGKLKVEPISQGYHSLEMPRANQYIARGCRSYCLIQEFTRKWYTLRFVTIESEKTLKPDQFEMSSGGSIHLQLCLSKSFTYWLPDFKSVRTLENRIELHQRNYNCIFHTDWKMSFRNCGRHLHFCEIVLEEETLRRYSDLPFTHYFFAKLKHQLPCMLFYSNLPANASMMHTLDKVLKTAFTNFKDLQVLDSLVKRFLDAAFKIEPSWYVGTSYISQLQADRLYEVERCLCQFDKEYSLKDLAGMSHMLMPRFQKVFKLLYGVELEEFRAQEKIRQAMILLDDGESVNFVVEKLGYTSAMEFSNEFAKRFPEATFGSLVH